MGHSCMHHNLHTRNLSYMHRICFAESEYTGVQEICCTCHSLPQSKGIGRAPIQVACNQTNLMVPVRQHSQQPMFVQAIANSMKQHPYQQGQGSLKSCSSLFRPIWPAIRAITYLIQAATACQVAGEQVSRRRQHAWATVTWILPLIITSSAFSIEEAVLVNILQSH